MSDIGQRQAVDYLTGVISEHPAFDDVFEVIAVEQVSATTLVLDLDDGTTIRIDVDRYRGE